MKRALARAAMPRALRSPPANRVRAALVVALAFALAACGESAQTLTAAGQQLAQQNQHAAAVVKYKAALGKDAESGRLRFLLGRSLLLASDPTNAAVELAKAHERQHSPDELVPLLAKAWVLTGDTKKLTRQFSDTVLADATAQASLKVSLATAYAAEGDRAQTEQAAAAALAAKPDFGPALILQARLLAGRGEHEQARQIIDPLLARDPTLHEAWHLLGEIILHTRDDTAAAQQAFAQALQVERAYVPAHLALVGLQLQAKDFPAAKAQAGALRAVLPQHPQTLFVDAQIAFHERDLVRARDAVTDLLKGAPNHAGILLLAGAVEVQGGSLVLAQSYFARALQSDPNSVLARRNLAQVHLRLGQPAQALEALQPLLAAKAQNAEAQALAGEAQLQLGQAAAAEASFARAAKLSPDNLRIRTAIALAAIAQGEDRFGFAELEALSSLDRESFVDSALVGVRLKRREFDQALRVAQRMTKNQPNSPTALHTLGQVHLARQDGQAARQAFEQALRFDPRFFPATASLAGLDREENRIDAARARLQAAVQHDPKNAQARLALADLLKRSGAPAAEAQAVLKAAVAALPAHPAARLRLIEDALAAQNARGALQLAQEATTAVPNDPELLDALGRAQAAVGEPLQAVATFNQVASLDVQSGMPHFRVAEIHRAMGNQSAAELQFKRALEVQPDLTLAQAPLLDLLLPSGREAEAMALARRLQQRRPLAAAGYLFEGMILTRRQAHEQAAAAYRYGLDRAGEHSELALALHKALWSAGRPSEADKLAARWTRDHPDDLAFVYQLALTEIRRQNWAQAEEKLRRVVAEHPDHALALNNLAWLLVTRAKPGGVELARRAVDLLPQRPALMDTLALALAAEKQATQALDVQKKAVELAPQDLALRLNLAKIAQQAGDKALARKELVALQATGTTPALRDEAQKLLRAL
jgi:putative PEP-CTERM system TPR-repeat lipoprotein